MAEELKINGFHLYHWFLSGYENLLKQKNYLNDINVFPVADGDTGNNMVATMYATLQLPNVFRSFSKTLLLLADRALSSARGNSGIILAQYINGLANECPNRSSITPREFTLALTRAAAETGKALEDPKEGTMLTVMNVWSLEIDRLMKMGGNIQDRFSESLISARDALEETKNQLDVLRRSQVVDAGASGFVSFLEGISRMLITGKVSWQRAAYIGQPEDYADHEHEVPASSEDITFRYCTEALLFREGGFPDDEKTTLKSAIAPLGDSSIISFGREKAKIHIHTNDPSRLFFILKDYGRIIEQKVDDMVHQYRAVHQPVARIAILTDSIADIPSELIDRYQIHVIPLKILWGDDEYLDRLTISTESFYQYLDSREAYPSSSVPDPLRVEQVFSWLVSHYDSVIAIPVGKVLSGTWKVMQRSAEKVVANGYKFAVIDSKLNSAAQGLVVLAAAEDASNGKSHEEIIARTEERIRGSKILVSVATFKYMVRGGRISALKGAIAAMTHLKPIIALDETGKGIAYGASFSKSGSRKKILRHVSKNSTSIRRYAVVHAAAPEQAAEYARKVAAVLGMQPEYIMEISPIVGIHSGIGAVAIAWI